MIVGYYIALSAIINICHLTILGEGKIFSDKDLPALQHKLDECTSTSDIDDNMINGWSKPNHDHHFISEIDKSYIFPDFFPYYIGYGRGVILWHSKAYYLIKAKFEELRALEAKKDTL